MSQEPQACYFDAELLPHRSLGQCGFRLLIAVVAAANLAVGIGFYWLAAWPVFGFMGLDVALLYFLFRLNYRDAQQKEVVRLTDDALIVRRVKGNGEEEKWSLEPYWLRVEMDDPPRHRRQPAERRRHRLPRQPGPRVHALPEAGLLHEAAGRYAKLKNFELVTGTSENSGGELDTVEGKLYIASDNINAYEISGFTIVETGNPVDPEYWEPKIDLSGFSLQAWIKIRF